MKKKTKKPVKKAVKKVTVAKKATNADHRKQRGRTAPNRALSVTKKTTVEIVKTKETSKNKKSSKSKWTKKSPKKLPKAKVVKKAPATNVPAVPFPGKEAELFDLTKKLPQETINPVDNTPKPWGSICPPCLRPTAKITPAVVVNIQPAKVEEPVVTKAEATWTGDTAVPQSQLKPDINPPVMKPIWTVPVPSCQGVSSYGSSSGWRTVASVVNDK